MAYWRLYTTSPFEVVAQCPNCGMYYKTYWQYVAAHAQAGSMMFCSGYFNAPGCQRFSDLSFPDPFDMQKYLEFSRYVNPGMIFLSTPMVQRKAPPPRPRPPATPNPGNVVVKLCGGHCFEEEDDVYNDDLYVLYAARDARGNRCTGSSGLVKRIDEGDSFRFDAESNVIYVGNPGDWLQLGFIAMESEDSHNSQRIQNYWRAAEFAASYIPAYGEFISYAIKGINLAIKYFDEDDRLGAIEVPFGANELISQAGYVTTYEWNFKGSNNGSSYRYRIDYTVEVSG